MQRTWLWPWLIGRLEILPYARLFRWAAYYHDIAFAKGWTEEDLKRANDMFYKLMLAVAKSKLQFTFANIYYNLVKRYWYLYFNFSVTYENFN